MFSFREVIRAIRAYGVAHRLVIKYKLWKWVLLPGIIYSVLFCIGLYFVWHFSESTSASFSEFLGIERWIQKLESGWVSFLFILLGLAIRLVFLAFYVSLFKYIILILGTPFFVRLSEHTRRLINPQAHPTPSTGSGTSRGIRLVVRNIGYQSGALFLLLLVSLLPVLGWVVPLLCFLMECFFFGFSMLDYSARLQGYSGDQSIHFVKDHRGLALGNGLVFYLLMFIPVIGWMMGLSYAVIAATISLNQKY